MELEEVRKKIDKSYLCSFCGKHPSVRITEHIDISMESNVKKTYFSAYCITPTCPMRRYSAELKLSETLDEAVEKWNILVLTEYNKFIPK